MAGLLRVEDLHGDLEASPRLERLVDEELPLVLDLQGLDEPEAPEAVRRPDAELEPAIERGVGELREDGPDAAVAVDLSAGEAAVATRLTGEGPDLRAQLEAQVRGRRARRQPAAVEDPGAHRNLDHVEGARFELLGRERPEARGPCEDVHGALRRGGPAVDLEVNACVRDVDRRVTVCVRRREGVAPLGPAGRLTPGGDQRHAVLEEAVIGPARHEPQADARRSGHAVSR